MPLMRSKFYQRSSIFLTPFCKELSPIERLAVIYLEQLFWGALENTLKAAVFTKLPFKSERAVASASRFSISLFLGKQKK